MRKFIPESFSDLFGQPDAVATLGAFAVDPHSTAFLFAGGTGVGKTSSANVLARVLGVDIAQAEMGGLHEIASGEQDGASVRAKLKELWTCPMFGSGWKVLIVNEADRMTSQAEVVWLDALEDIPDHTVVIFTTNNAGDMSQRFIDRCERIDFISDAAELAGTIPAAAARIWTDMGMGELPVPVIPDRLVVVDGKISYRRLARQLEQAARKPAGAAGAPAAKPEKWWKAGAPCK